MSDAGSEASTRLGFGTLLSFDVAAPASSQDRKVAADRADGVAVSVPFLIGSHLLWVALLVGTFLIEGRPLGLLPAPLGGLVLADLCLWSLFRRPSLAPHAKLRFACLHSLVVAGLVFWALSMVTASDSLAAKAALVAALGAGIAAYFTVPLLLILACAATVCGLAFASAAAEMICVAAAATSFLVFLGISRAGDLITTAREQLAAQWELSKARRFVSEFEECGRGWFWETNADGLITYLSADLAREIAGDPDAVIGSRFETLLRVAESEEAADARRSLGFHLAARFPFTDVVVRAPGRDDVWWSVSGTPNFDEFGRFMGFRGIGANLSEERRSEAEKSKLARFDSLTGLPNRPTMRAMLDQALANAEERRQGCALMMIDLDRFKHVNDTLGHPVGDKLLKLVSQRLSDVLGQDGQVGRLGGDEFEAILPGVGEETRLSDIAGRMIAEVCKPYEIEGHRVEVGTSIGIAVAWPGQADPAELIRDADLALYASKAAGRGTFRFFAPEMRTQATERQILERDLREALAKDQFRLLFQPVVESVSEEVVAFEALLRWHHPVRSVLPPAVIVPLAEECGLMPRIGEWVLRTACAEAATWPEHIRIAVNLSPSQFADPSLPAMVTSALASSGLAAERLELEITEGVFPVDGAAPEQILAGLKGLGVRLALDNFGTGRSGLGHLRDAPLDKIKIDQSFVRGAANARSRNAAIIRAIVVLAESLGMDTTAEGAETLEELTLIRSLGCSQVQGFIFGKPMPAQEAHALAATSKPTSEVVAFSRPPRHRLIRMGRIHVADEELAVRLRNISAGGAMIECDRDLAPETKLLLDLDEAGQLPAQVRWCQSGQVGLCFEDEFELRRLARLRPAATTPGGKMLTPSYLKPAGAASRSGRKAG
ncbi:EAL domain-containing protein [Sphingomonas parva]|uniref:EAL domain-containing protein n=1 Tax=Sphingomonas parva TaxID=2555898 RepID=A0A4Y8ZSN7_9SPHN|nr:EAL domain-containing protein [Sphingomonas parva]TFI59023.1 EAL domain-containing protein [Sphingomonas parva]